VSFKAEKEIQGHVLAQCEEFKAQLLESRRRERELERKVLFLPCV
jgi:hypothetical protein